MWIGNDHCSWIMLFADAMTLQSCPALSPGYTEVPPITSDNRITQAASKT